MHGILAVPPWEDNACKRLRRTIVACASRGATARSCLARWHRATSPDTKYIAALHGLHRHLRMREVWAAGARPRQRQLGSIGKSKSILAVPPRDHKPYLPPEYREIRVWPTCRELLLHASNEPPACRVTGALRDRNARPLPHGEPLPSTAPPPPTLAQGFSCNAGYE